MRQGRFESAEVNDGGHLTFGYRPHWNLQQSAKRRATYNGGFE
jgi:hypothetical protein